MNYEFKTDVTMKPYNYDEYWVDRDMIENIFIEAVDLPTALKMFAVAVEERGISISKNAIKTKQPMYKDDEDGNAKQVGYVITGKTLIADRSANVCCYQYVDLWTEITLPQAPVYPKFEA